MSRHLQKLNIYIQMIRSSRQCIGTPSYHTNTINKPVNSILRSSINMCCCKTVHSTPVWFKKKAKKSKKYDDDDDEDIVAIEDDEEGFDSNSSKVMNLKVTSLRTDMVLKSAFQIARNKIEKLFYESRIRVNGYKIYKKSHNVSLGDEIDVVKGFSTVNPKFLSVQRVKILGASNPTDDEPMTLKIRRYKNLTIDNYEEDPYKESSPPSASEE
ncbi:uncharacterized protein C6orf203 [Diaphorina citri]|uniref:Uncharacterized protein C6orf203 n=1 Tax=Diaphorina citri TaxID=121845 RepID=A0A1S3CUW2_DIACI|nr:uncharacterized protein C6orf203 [Diaphorina citri]